MQKIPLNFYVIVIYIARGIREIYFKNPPVKNCINDI